MASKQISVAELRKKLENYSDNATVFLDIEGGGPEGYGATVYVGTTELLAHELVW